MGGLEIFDVFFAEDSFRTNALEDLIKKIPSMNVPRSVSFCRKWQGVNP